MYKGNPDLQGLSTIDRLEILFFVIRLYWRKKVNRHFHTWRQSYILHLPVSIATRQALIALVMLLVIPVKPNPGSLVAIYGSSLCLSILVSRYTLIIPAQRNYGRLQRNRDIIDASDRHPDLSR